MSKKWDAFISHASEDKADFVRPLAQALSQLGVKIWYDDFSLEVGDSLSRSIDKGLADSKYGVVVVSSFFIQKKWPERELRGLVAREVEEEQKLILPIWLGITKQEVLNFSPTLADTIALQADRMSAEEIALTLLKTVRPDIYKEHPRAELEKMLSSEAIQNLQEELEYVRGELAEYQCPDCHAPVTLRQYTPDNDETMAFFACGSVTFNGAIFSICSSDPRFPKLEEYEIQIKKDWREESRFEASLIPQTENARLVDFFKRSGKN